MQEGAGQSFVFLFVHVLLNERELPNTLGPKHLKNEVDNKNTCHHNKSTLFVGQKADTGIAIPKK